MKLRYIDLREIVKRMSSRMTALTNQKTGISFYRVVIFKR